MNDRRPKHRLRVGLRIPNRRPPQNLTPTTPTHSPALASITRRVMGMTRSPSTNARPAVLQRRKPGRRSRPGRNHRQRRPHTRVPHTHKQHIRAVVVVIVLKPMTSAGIARSFIHPKSYGPHPPSPPFPPVPLHTPSYLDEFALSPCHSLPVVRPFRVEWSPRRRVHVPRKNQTTHKPKPITLAVHSTQTISARNSPSKERE